MSLKYNLAITLSFVVLCLCIFTSSHLVLFLSSQKPLQLKSYSFVTNIGQFDTFWSAAIDVFLLSAFLLQHSLQKRDTIKNFIFNHGLGACERLLYNLGSCFFLLLLMFLWQPIHSWTVWEVSIHLRPILWWYFALVHGICWLFIYSGCFIMDITELLGVKQVFHYFQGLPDPMSSKSDGLRRFYSHMRHPSFMGITVILFAHPVMQIDRLFLAHAVVGYMILRNRVDDIDYAYQKRLLQRKKRDLNSNE